MKNTLIALILVAGAFTASAWRLVWNPSPSTNVTSYVVYAVAGPSNASPQFTMRVDVGTATNTSLASFPPGPWNFGVAARSAEGVESDLALCFGNLTEKPAPPTNVRTLFIQSSIDLTNWTNQGFFRLLIQ